ncbi:restriction endonuclease subunit S [Paenibacillus polymyxa]|uniref:restriction endonuclease subunit S n=1 Tax=Paenibacillus polymyxa TaxID=1406 RepID=UPI001BEB4505|nr:restriction endonuclease subunit S [Paenibacillus polymyxa]MBT2282219.1 restriction endonuclease subunit S [Paenibacillus polymyxa]
MDGWKIISVDDACTITDCQHKTAPIVEYITPYKMLRTSNIRNGKIDTINVNYVTEETYKAWSVRGELNINDVILTREAPMGEVGIIRSEERFFLGQRMLQLKANQKLIQPKYLYLSLLSSYFQKQLAPLKGNGSIVANIRIPELKKMRLLIPSKEEEQQKIASILSTWDKAIELKEKLIEQKKKQKKGLMQKLLTGNGRLPGYEGEWKKDKLKKLCDKIMDGTHSTPKYVDSGIPFYSVENVTRKDFENSKYITQEEHEAISSRCKVERNDILITRIGSIGDAVLVDWDHESSIYVSLALLKTKDKIMPEFLVQYMGTDIFKREILSKSLTTAIPQKINLGDLGEVNISYPYDVREQSAIVDFLSKADEEIYLLERDLKETGIQRKGLMQLLLTGKVRVKV